MFSVDPAPLDFGLEKSPPHPESSLAHPVTEQLDTTDPPKETPIGLRELGPVQFEPDSELPILNVFNEDFLPPLEGPKPALKIEDKSPLIV